MTLDTSRGEGGQGPLDGLGHWWRAGNAPANFVGKPAEVFFHRGGAHHLRQNFRCCFRAGGSLGRRARVPPLNATHRLSQGIRLHRRELRPDGGRRPGGANKTRKKQKETHPQLKLLPREKFPAPYGVGGEGGG